MRRVRQSAQGEALYVKIRGINKMLKHHIEIPTTMSAVHRTPLTGAQPQCISGIELGGAHRIYVAQGAST